jgi:hypothetical protein
VRPPPLWGGRTRIHGWSSRTSRRVRRWRLRVTTCSSSKTQEGGGGRGGVGGGGERTSTGRRERRLDVWMAVCKIGKSYGCFGRSVSSSSTARARAGGFCERARDDLNSCPLSLSLPTPQNPTSRPLSTHTQTPLFSGGAPSTRTASALSFTITRPEERTQKRRERQRHRHKHPPPPLLLSPPAGQDQDRRAEMRATRVRRMELHHAVAVTGRAGANHAIARTFSSSQFESSVRPVFVCVVSSVENATRGVQRRTHRAPREADSMLTGPCAPSSKHIQKKNSRARPPAAPPPPAPRRRRRPPRLPPPPLASTAPATSALPRATCAAAPSTRAAAMVQELPPTPPPRRPLPLRRPSAASAAARTSPFRLLLPTPLPLLPTPPQPSPNLTNWTASAPSSTTFPL